MTGDHEHGADLGWQLNDEAAIAALADGRHGDPFAILGPHTTPHGVAIRALRPGADTAEAIDASGKRLTTMPRRHAVGFFEGLLDGESDPAQVYRLRFTRGSETWDEEDAYRFPPVLGDLDVYLLAEGTHRRVYERLGAHLEERLGVAGVSFAVWAPNASRVSVIGDFNHWDGRRHPMRKRHEVGVWEIFVPGVGAGALYQYEILGSGGELLPAKADPVGFAHEVPPAKASIVHGLPDWRWNDADWMEGRASRQSPSAPVSVYEVHLGSWRRNADGTLPTWRELGDQLIPYVRDLGFTHIECLPVSEHPFSGSWGYQPVGLFAPTSRFGPPEGFASFIDRCHQAGIGVLIDWVPAHFPSDAHGLGLFDGTNLYEHADPRQGFHRDWNTLIYNFGRREVANFLTANATFWLDRYHVDGLRVDAVASMLYLDYSREADDWVPNVHGGNQNLEAVAFLRTTTESVRRDAPGASTIAEESTAWPGVSRSIESGGLGFDFKWNMGWMHDTLDYIGHDPVHRRHHQGAIPFGIGYAFSENYVLPLSHDEVVHGKGSLIGRMPGDRWQKFANLRAYFGFMWAHPGKKLLFMGGEFAQEREWNHDTQLDWHLTDDPMHAGVQRLVRDLNRLYRSEPAMHELDCDPAGFEWIDASDSEGGVFAFLRHSSHRETPMLIVCHFTPVVRRDYRIGVPKAGAWVERLNSDAEAYGGSGVGNSGLVEAEATPSHGRPASLTLTLPPLSILVLQPDTRVA